MKKSKIISGLIGLTVFIGLGYFLSEIIKVWGVLPFVISFMVGIVTRNLTLKILNKQS
jgi:Na+/glutamate symporter